MMIIYCQRITRTNLCSIITPQANKTTTFAHPIARTNASASERNEKKCYFSSIR